MLPRPFPHATPWAFVLAALVLLAACDQGDVNRGSQTEEPPASSVVRVAADPSLAAQALAVAGELLAPSDLTAEPAAQPAEADLVVSASPPGAEAPSFATGYWVPVVSLPSAAPGLSMSGLADIVAGRVADWSALAGEATALRVLLPADPMPPVEQWWPGIVPAAEQLSVDEIVAVLRTDPGALALLPLDSVDARVRSLSVDGVNVVFGTGDVSSYPLVGRAWVRLGHVEDDALARLLDGVSREMAVRLALPPPDPIVLRATGDIIPARCAYAKQRDYGDYRHAFLELGPWLAEADLTIGSLDAAVSDAGVPFDCVDTLSLLAPAASVEGLAFAGFDLLTVAANHVKDCGQAWCDDQAFFDTLANLRARGIEPVGGGADLTEARQPAVITVKGVRFAFLAYDEIAPYYHAEPGVPGTAPLNEAYLRQDVAAAAARADVVVVLPHWGAEYTADPGVGQQALAAAAVEAGADLIVGNHPHWVQAAQFVDGAFVAYALGNFVFDQDWSVPTQQGAVLDVVFHGTELKAVEYHPIRIVDRHQPVFAGPEEAKEILDRIWTASSALD